MIFFEDAIFLDEPVTQNVIYLEGPPSMVFPVWKQEKTQHLKQGWWRRFQTTQMWMGEGQEAYNLPAPASPCPWSQHT